MRKKERPGTIANRGIFLVGWILLLSFSLCWAQYERPGSTDAQFLKIDVSARAAGMAGAYISVVDGAEAAYYNPAALVRVPRLDAVFTHTRWFAGINHEFVSVAYRFHRLMAVAFSTTALYTDLMEVRTPLQPDGTGETFWAGNYRFSVSLARYLTNRVTLGATFSYIYMFLYHDFSARAVAGDIAVLYISEFRHFQFGMKIANFGSEVKYVNESYPLPTNFQFGMSMHVIENERQTVLMSISAMKPNDGHPLGQLGMEWNWGNFVFLRAGYKLNYDVARYALGMGLRWKLKGLRFRLDYAYNSYRFLGVAHRFGIGLEFGARE